MLRGQRRVGYGRGMTRQSLRETVRREFKRMGSGNELSGARGLVRGFAHTTSGSVSIHHASDWWLGDPHSSLYATCQQAIASTWGEAPLLVREGGSYGGITVFLERTLGCSSVHLPLGQSSDSAHLPNERIRTHNLTQGCKVLEKILLSFAASEEARHGGELVAE